MLNRLRTLLLISLITVLSGCGFNGLFYYPDENPVETPEWAESHYVKYGDKDSLHALFYKKDNPIATIFVLHGNAGSLSSWSTVGELFHKENYQVFLIDFPGFGNSTGKAKHRQVYTATQASVEYFKSMPEITGQKKILMGFSLGGNLAVKVGNENPDLFDAMIIEGPFESHKTIAITRVPRPLKFAPFLLVNDAVKGKKLIQTWTKPLLIVHSSDDQVCEYKMGKTLYENATSTDKKELWTIDGPHLAGLKLYYDEYMSKIKGLIE